MADVTCDSEISTLSSVYSEKSTDNRHHHHHHHHDHNRCNRYKASGTVAYQNMLRTLDGGKLSRKRGCEHLHPSIRGVSMATQVINPKAIGGSLKFGRGRMLCQRYYPGLETESSGSDLFRTKKRIPWDKLACYALFISIILVLLTGIVIAVGYMQSEKHRILSEKLQGDVMFATTWRPRVHYFTTTTAPEIPTSPPLEAENNTVYEELIVVEDPIQTNDTKGVSMDFSTESDANNNELEIYEIPDNDDMNESTLPDADDDSTRKSEQTVRSEQKTDPFTQATTVSDDENNGRHTEIIVIDQHKPPAEVKVLPPKGFSFRGFSLEIPIYNQDNSTIESYNADHSSTTLSPPDPNLSLDGLFDSPLFRATPSNSIEILPSRRSSIQIITPSNLNTDLFSSDEESDHSDNDFDGEIDSEMSASSGRRQVPISRPSDNMYTPRPGSNPMYPDRPLFSSYYNNQEEDKLLEKFSSNRSEVRVLPPLTSTTTPRPAKASDSTSDFVRNNAIEAPKLETTTTAPLIEYQIGTPSSISTSFVTSAPSAVPTTVFEFDFSQLTTPAPATATGPTSLIISPHSAVNVNPESLSKRTFNFDFDTSAATNPFANILGNQGAVTGVIGSATSTGASLGLHNQFNFDNYFTYQPLPPLNLPSGTVPIDLASSYIQAGGQQSSTQGHSSGTDYSNLYSNPTASYGQNGGSYGQNDGSYGQNGGSYGQNGGSFGQNGGSYGQNGGLYGHNGGSFTQHGTSTSNNFPLVTTSASNPNPPSYNTITQGIHLLSLLSGSIPQHLVDTQASASSFNEHGAKPELQIAALAGYGGSARSFSNKIPDLATASSNIQSSSSHNANLYSSKSLPEGQSSSSSFGQSIVSKLAEFSNVHKQGPALDSIPSASEFLEATSAVKAAAENDISEKDLKGLLRFPQSKGTSSPSDSEIAASEVQPVSMGKDYISLEPKKPTINFAKSLVSQARLKTESTQLGSKGLKSGFYT